MDIGYEREGSGVYMTIARPEGDLGYRERMILSASFSHILPVSLRHFNGASGYYYDVRGSRSIMSIYDKNPMKAGDVRSILSALGDAVSELSGYLLGPDLLILDPECVMQSMMDESVRFCCCPAPFENERESLARFMIEHIDNSDEEAVRLAYGYYDIASGGSFDLSGLLGASPAVELKPQPEGIMPETDVLSRVVEEEKESYYFTEIKEEEEEGIISDREILKPLVICAALIITAGAAYTFIFMHPHQLERLGIDQEDFIVAGALLTGFLALVIISVLRVFRHRKEVRAEVPEEKEEWPLIPTDTRGKEEYEPEDTEDDEGTVLLGGVPATGGSFLIGYAGDKNIRLQLEGSSYRVGKSKKGNDGVIDAQGVSRVHALFEKSASGWFVSDLNSTNGTRVNGRLLEGNNQQALSHGDCIKLGECELLFIESGL